jgi:hypothetical protein
MPELDRSRFAQLVADLGCPTVMYGSFKISGRAGWADAIPRSTRRERQQLLKRLRRPLMLATPEARARFKSWRKTVRPQPPMAPTERRAWIRDRVELHGDESFLPIIVDALITVPDYVVDTVLAEVAWVGVGLNSTAWFSSTCFMTRDGNRLPHVVVLGPRADPRVIRHETGHAWFAQQPSADRAPAVSVHGVAGLRELATAQGWSHRIDDDSARQERLADAFADVWEFADVRSGCQW